MNEFEDQMASAGAALTALAEGPGVAAAEALEAAFGKAGERQGQAVNLNMHFAPGTDERGAMQSRGAIAATLARLVSSGGRFL